MSSAFVETEAGRAAAVVRRPAGGRKAGDVLAIVTDGVTEAMSPEEHELGDDRVCAALRRLSGGSAIASLAGLVAAVDEWAGGRGRSDDLTALILKAR